MEIKIGALPGPDYIALFYLRDHTTLRGENSFVKI